MQPILTASECLIGARKSKCNVGKETEMELIAAEIQTSVH